MVSKIFDKHYFFCFSKQSSLTISILNVNNVQFCIFGNAVCFVILTGKLTSCCTCTFRSMSSYWFVLVGNRMIIPYNLALRVIPRLSRVECKKKKESKKKKNEKLDSISREEGGIITNEMKKENIGCSLTL